ncbi:hypothetical protein GC175_13530 [bacterium]|nr:hypothetical protein [bacterium]
MQDTYWSTLQGTYDERRRMYHEFCATDNTGGRTGLFSQIGRLALGQEPVNETAIREAVTAAEIECDDLNILYRSPSLGKVELAWNGPLRVGGPKSSCTTTHASPIRTAAPTSGRRSTKSST